MRRVQLDRHYDVRKHETWEADVPDEMLTNPLYFDEGLPTADFDQWMCDNGDLLHEDAELLDDDDLEWSLEIGPEVYDPEDIDD